MQDESPRPAPGSGRRRPRNNAARHTPQRNYASENDMSNAQARLPQTPQKSASSSPAPASAAGQQPSSRRGGKDKRPRNTPMSPDSTRTVRHQASHPNSIPKAAAANAFAGATFHASPAPSSLPLPSFLSKGAESPSARNGPGPGRPASSQAADPTMSTPSRVSPPQVAEAPIPTPSRTSPSPAARDSPLEFMFKADREEKEKEKEKEKARWASQARPGQHRNTRSASSISQSPIKPDTTQFGEPQSPSPARHGRSGMCGPTPDDGHPFGQSIGPSFSTPFQERIRAAKNNNAPNHPQGGNWEPMTPAPDTPDRSEALKRYLFGKPSMGGSGMGHAPQPQVPAVPAAPPAAPHANRAENKDPRGEEVVAMENNLRRMLNLDSSMMSRQPVHQSQ